MKRLIPYFIFFVILIIAIGIVVAAAWLNIATPIVTICAILAFGGLVSLLTFLILKPHSRFVSTHKSLFSLQEPREVRHMWILLGISLTMTVLLCSIALVYIYILEKEDNRTAAIATGISFTIGLILNLAIYYWSYGTNLSQARATKLIEGLMTGITSLGEETFEQILQLRAYLDLRKPDHAHNWLFMAIASPAFGILHSPQAAENFLDIFEDWLWAAQHSADNKLELVIWNREEHKKDFGADNKGLPSWSKERDETIKMLGKLALILARMGSLSRDPDKNVNVSILEAKRSDYRLCIAGGSTSRAVRAALILYAPLDKELQEGATKIDSLFFRYQEGKQGLTSLRKMYDRHKSNSMLVRRPDTAGYLDNPILFLKDFFGINEQDEQTIFAHLEAHGAIPADEAIKRLPAKVSS